MGDVGMPGFSMDTGLGNVVGGVGGAIVGGAGNIIAQNSANAANKEIAEMVGNFNAAEAQKARDWSEHMSNTAYQRSMNDMRAAGLNPMLAFSQGGASTPSGPSATMPAAEMESNRMGDALKGAVSTAFEAKKLNKDLEEQDSRIALNAAAKEAKQSEIQLNRESARSLDQGTKYKEVETQLAKTNLPTVAAEAQLRQAQAGINSKLVGWDAFTSRLTDFLGGVASAAASATRFGRMRDIMQRNQSEHDISKEMGKQGYMPVPGRKGMFGDGKGGFKRGW